MGSEVGSEEWQAAKGLPFHLLRVALDVVPVLLVVTLALFPIGLICLLDLGGVLAAEAVLVAGQRDAHVRREQPRLVRAAEDARPAGGVGEID